MTTSQTGYTQQDPSDSASEFRHRQFQIEQTLSRVRTVVLVQVISVTGGNGAVAAPTTVQVKPLVKWVDGMGRAYSHGLINNVQCWRPSSGLGAIILDPQANDIGLMAVCDRDSSVVFSSKKESQPGSRRKFDMADGVYLGSLFGATPSQYITFTSSGVTIADKNNNTIVMSSSGVSINGLQISSSGGLSGPSGGAVQLTSDVHTTGTVFADTEVQAKSGGTKVTLTQHIHSANNTPPTAGH